MLPLAAFTPRPFLSLVRDFRALGSLDRARFAVLAGQPVGHDLPAPPDDLLRHSRVAWVLAEPGHRAAAAYTVVRVGLALVEGAVLTAVLTLPVALRPRRGEPVG